MTHTRLITGGLLIAVPLVFVAGFTGLQLTFEYPDILRLPEGEVLTRFAAGGFDLRAYWYLMFVAALALIPAAVGFALMNWKENPFAAAMVAASGIVGGLVQALGLLRWTVLVPSLAASYVAPGASAIDKALATSAFDTANAYLGMGVGEHMGYLFTAVFTVMIAILVLKRSAVLAWSGIVLATGVASGMLETFGINGVSAINAIAYMGWSVWCVFVGVTILRGGEGQTLAVPQAA